MNRSLTVVLPIHNAEATLRSSVEGVVEVASDLTQAFNVLIVDDGSTDDSFEIASELSHHYPQVRVVRQAQRRGLGPTLNRVRKMVKSQVVMVHDGVSAIDAEQLTALWNGNINSGGADKVSAADLLRPAQNQAAMAIAHQRLASFHLMDTEQANDPAKANASEPHSKPADGVGVIPPLPRPNFMDAVGDFALGE